MPCQEVLSDFIFLFFLGMLPPIYLDYDPSFKTYKIDNVVIDRMLSAEFYPFKLLGTQMMPKSLLGLGLGLP